jgi:RNA polymerase sigma-70 factor (ECF subfamily)
VENETLPSDAEIWDRIRRRDGDAFDAFYRENAERLQTFLRHATGSPQAAEDLMQETFTGIWQRPNGYMPDQGSLRTYLYGIARKRAAEWWRKQRPKETSGVEPTVASTETISVAINEALQRLPPEQRTLLWLREVEGQSYAELAEIVGIPVGTVRSRLFAAREALRQIWRSPRQI